MKYSESLIEDIKSNVSLEEYLRKEGFSLNKRGNNLVMLCPFHEDKDPSLIVTPSKNLWHCMGCDEGGSIIDFVMKFKSLSFLAAVESLEGSPGKKPATKKIKKIKKSVPRAKLLERVCQFYEKTFKEDRRGLDYLKSRGINEPAIFENFRIGFCNGSLKKAIPEGGEVVEQLKELGILQNNKRESFENCVVFPLFNERGEVESFYARKINDDFYVNHIYLKGERNALFNGNACKQYPEIILTESVIDGLSLYQAGFKNVLPCYGVNGFLAVHEKALKDNNINQVLIVFDNDKGGKESSIKIKEQVDPYVLNCSIKELSGAKDINSLLLKQGEDFLREAFAKKDNPLTRGNIKSYQELEDNEGIFIKYNERKYYIRGIDSSSTRLRANIKAENCTRFHIDTFDLYSAKSRRSFIKDTSILFKEESEIIENDMLGIIGQVEQFIKSEDKDNSSSAVMSQKERVSALRFGKLTSLMEEILKDTETLGYLGEDSNKLLSYLAMTSRLMNSPMSVMILSASGAGKSALQDTILSMCPDEDLMKFTTLTERALFYKDPDSLKHKILALAEEAGAEEASYAIRNLISSKELIIEATVKDSMSGRMTTMKNVVYGPTSVFKTTTNPETDAETRSRFIILTVDESRNQTRRILDHQREMMTFEGFIKSNSKASVIRKHKNFQRLLRPLKVFNPYAKLLTYQDNKLWARRDNPKYLQLINTIAFLHQLQRAVKVKNGLEYIEVELEDIALANELAGEIFGRNTDDLSSPARRLLKEIESLSEEKKRQKDLKSPHLSRREIREACGWGETYVRKILSELVRMDFLLVVRGGFGRGFSYELNPMNEEERAFTTHLANVEELKEKAKALGIYNNDG